MAARLRVDAWVIDDTGFVKDGDASPCVARQYSGTLGKVGNCQVAVSVHAASDAASAPLDWRLYMPKRWDQRCAEDPADAAAVVADRKRAAIPDSEHHRPKWQMALEMIDELIEWGRTPAVATADAGYGDTTAFRQGLTDPLRHRARTPTRTRSSDRHLPAMPPHLPHLTKYHWITGPN